MRKLQGAMLAVSRDGHRRTRWHWDYACCLTHKPQMSWIMLSILSGPPIYKTLLFVHEPKVGPENHHAYRSVMFKAGIQVIRSLARL